MKSESKTSCLGTVFLLVGTLVLIRYALPVVWKILAGLFAGALYLGIFVFLAFLAVLGYFTYKNLSRNKVKEGEKGYAVVLRVEDLYKALIERLHREVELNQVSVEELLQSEILMRENLASVRSDLIRLKDFASPQNQRNVSIQVREYQQQLRQSKEAASREVIEENLKMVQEKRERIESALEEIRQKEALVDLIYNSLVNVEEDLKFGRPVQRLFPPDLYQRFGLTPPATQPKLPPLLERSDE
jgi:predicted metal-dependent hydrolase